MAGLRKRRTQAAEAIARGLLEFAVFDLQPEIFQKVVLARLQQMSDQASALDEALFGCTRTCITLLMGQRACSRL